MIQHIIKYKRIYYLFAVTAWFMLLILFFYKIQSSKEIIQLFTDSIEKNLWTEFKHILEFDRKDSFSLVIKTLLTNEEKYIILLYIIHSSISICIIAVLFIRIIPFVGKFKKWYYKLIVGLFLFIIASLLLFYFCTSVYDCIDYLTFKGEGMFPYSFLLFMVHCTVLFIIIGLIVDAEFEDMQFYTEHIIEQDEWGQSVNESVEKLKDTPNKNTTNKNV